MNTTPVTSLPMCEDLATAISALHDEPFNWIDTAALIAAKVRPLVDALRQVREYVADDGDITPIIDDALRDAGVE